MLKRLALFLLITILPIQSWAVVDMRLQKETLPFVPVSIPAQVSHHPCHQEVNLSPDGQSSETNQASCNACSLCMAFGAILASDWILHFESPSQSFSTHLPRFSSEDIVLGHKPPIL